MAMVQTLSSRNEVPINFIVSPEDRPRPPQPLVERTLPLIDLSGLQCGALPSTKAETLSAIASACEEWGFFQAINHGIPVDIIEGARHSARAFFELPTPEKHGYAVNAEDQKDGDMEKLQGYGRTHFFRGAADDWMDSLFGFLAPPSLKKLHMWPSQPPQLRNAVESYGYEVESLIKRLLVAISKNLGFMDSDYLVNEFKCNNLFFRANYYPPCPRPDLVLGTHGHTDHGCLTVLLQDNEMDGLQVFKDSVWFSINPVPNAVVINVGDQLKVLTNGKYKSALHRGVVAEDKTIMTLVAHLDPPKLTH